MGKNKAQRTKDNAQPSSSSRSAELLTGSVSGFVGFGGLTDCAVNPSTPGLSFTNHADINNVDPHFQILLKKMGKKDAVTKFKALQEFGELCQNSELSVVEEVLMFWPRLYCSLTTDNDHRVREAVQVAHAAIIKKVGKKIAIYLKQFAGPWFVSQYDLYPPAASAASHCFNTTFSTQKFVTAIIHCQDEILQYISDNIVVQTSQSLNINKTLTPEEKEDKYLRLLTSSLKAYSFYLKTVPETEIIDKTIDYHKKIISNGKFWKLSKHETPVTRTAFFSVLSSLILHALPVIVEEKKKILTMVINSLDESDPALLNAVWESLLLAITKFDDWSNVVSLEKLFFPKLWKVLKTSARNCANIIYPNLLPLMSEVTKLNDINKETFFNNFFDSMHQGFSGENTKLSRSEIQALGSSYFECFRYATLNYCDKEDVCLNLLKTRLIPVVETCIQENSRIKTAFFCELTHLIRYWGKHRNNSELPSYGSLIKTFWQELSCLLKKLLVGLTNIYDGDANRNIESSITELLWYLKNAPLHNRKNLKVKFSDSTESDESQKSSSVPTIENIEDAEFLTEFQELINDFCSFYFNQIIEQPHRYDILNVVKIIEENENKDLFSTLAKRCCNKESLLEFYEYKISNLFDDCGDKIDPLIHFIFIMMMHMTDSEKKNVLKILENSDMKEKILETILQFAFSEKFKEDVVIQDWCKQESITSILVSKVGEITNDFELNSDKNIFVKIFKTGKDGNLCINQETINEISLSFLELVKNLPWDNKKHIQCTTTLISKLLSLSHFHKNNFAAITLLKAIFWINIRSFIEQNGEDDTTESKISNDAYEKGLNEIIKILPHEDFEALLKYISSLIWEKILSKNSNEETAIRDSLIHLLFKLFSTVIKNSEYGDKKFVITCITELDIRHWVKNVTQSILYDQVLTGKLYGPNLRMKSLFCRETFEVDLETSSSEDDIDKCLLWALAITKLLDMLLSDKLIFEELDELVINLFYVATLCDLYFKNYKSSKHFNTISELIDILDDLGLDKLYLSFVEYKDATENDIIENISQKLIAMGLEYGGIFPSVVKRYHNFIISKDLNKTLECIIESDTKIASDTYLQYIQVLNLYDNEILHITDEEFRKMFTTRRHFHNLEIHSIIDAFEIIAKYQKKEFTPLCFDCNINEVAWDKICLTLEVATFFISCIRLIPEHMNIDQWDRMVMSVSYWNMSLLKSANHLDNIKVKALVIATSKLYTVLQEFFNEYEQHKTSGVPPDLPDAWKHVFLHDIQYGIFKIWSQLAEKYCDEKNLPIIFNIPLEFLGKSLKSLITVPNVGMSEDELLQWLLRILQSSNLNLQLSAYIILNKIAYGLVEQDKAVIEIEDLREKTFKLSKFETILRTTQSIVNAILMDIKLCDVASCTIQPHTDSYTYTISYLFAWSVALNMCAKAHGDLRYQYGEILKDELFPSFLNNIFRLMPVEVLQDGKNKSNKLYELFNTEPSFDFSESWTEKRLDNIVCWLYKNCLRYLPVLVRQWWSTADSRVSAAVDKITSLFVSPALCQELQNNKMSDPENMQIKVHPSAREIVALYTMDDTKLELKIALPINYPLGTVSVEPGQHVGGTANWRNCHMQLSIFLTHQNGSVWDGLKLWKSNLDKRFAGVEECCICFSIFHISTYQIPKLTCQTCRKRFHKLCLYKWFSTSRKSTCPICRNVF